MLDHHRRLLPAEFPAAAALVVDAFRSGYAGLLAPSALAIMRPEYLLDHWKAAKDPHLVGLFQQGALVGVARVGAAPDDPGMGHLFSLYIDPQHTGRGLGSQLLEIATTELRQQGFEQATLWVFEGNDRANALYRRAGWTATGRTRIEPEWQERQMELHLALGANRAAK